VVYAIKKQIFIYVVINSKYLLQDVFISFDIIIKQMNLFVH